MRHQGRRGRPHLFGQRFGQAPTADACSGKRGSGEEGSTLILIIFSAALSLALILGVSAATSLYLERKRLLTLADGAALAASESFDLSSVGANDAGGMVRPVLTNAAVSQAAQQYIARARANASDSRLEDLTLSKAVTEDGRSATIELASFWRPPVVSLFLPEGVRIDVESTARSVFF